MSDKVPGLLNNLSLSYWYRFLLYVAGVLLILGVVLGVKITSVEVVPFSFWTILLMTILWIYDEAASLIKYDSEWYSFKRRRIALHIIFFLLWVFVAALTLF